MHPLATPAHTQSINQSISLWIIALHADVDLPIKTTKYPSRVGQRNMVSNNLESFVRSWSISSSTISLEKVKIPIMQKRKQTLHQTQPIHQSSTRANTKSFPQLILHWLDIILILKSVFEGFQLGTIPGRRQGQSRVTPAENVRQNLRINRLRILDSHAVYFTFRSLKKVTKIKTLNSKKVMVIGVPYAGGRFDRCRRFCPCPVCQKCTAIPTCLTACAPG